MRRINSMRELGATAMPMCTVLRATRFYKLDAMGVKAKQGSKVSKVAKSELQAQKIISGSALSSSGD